MRRNKLPINLSITNLLTPAFLALGALLCVVSQVEAAPIYSQILPEEPVGAFSSQDRPIGQIIADDFMLNGTSPFHVRSLRLIGGCCHIGITPPVDNFRVVFFEDGGGKPGLPVAGGDFLIGSAYRRTPTGGRLLNGVNVPVEYIINFQDAVLFDPEVVYWISVMNNIGPTQGWVWAKSNGLSGQIIAGTSSSLENASWTTFSNKGMWFELGDQPIPEPNTLVILAAAVVPSVIHYRRPL